MAVNKDDLMLELVRETHTSVKSLESSINGQNGICAIVHKHEAAFKGVFAVLGGIIVALVVNWVTK